MMRSGSTDSSIRHLVSHEVRSGVKHVARLTRRP
jgi:hypothetical protein